jgi:hypothetical protein
VSANRSRPIRKRRGREEMLAIKTTIHTLLEGDHPMTARQVFYRLVSVGRVRKTEAEYKQTVVRLLSEMRLAGELPFGWVADNTRWMRKPQTFDSIEECLTATAEAYRRSVWTRQDCYVEVWTEKDAISGVLYPITSLWDVPLMLTKGYPSLTFVHGAAEAIAATWKPTYIYFLGDLDPSGLDIARSTEARLREFAPEAEITFERIAVTEQQVSEHNLLTRPTKTTDTRSRSFKGESVEVDALPPAVLRDFVHEAIEQHVDQHELSWLQRIEQEERIGLYALAGEAAA